MEKNYRHEEILRECAVIIESQRKLRDARIAIQWSKNHRISPSGEYSDLWEELKRKYPELENARFVKNLPNERSYDNTPADYNGWRSANTGYDRFNDEIAGYKISVFQSYGYGRDRAWGTEINYISIDVLWED